MRRILMIDDDALLAAPLATYFRRFDYELDSAVTPSQGLAKLRTGTYDAAILDVMLPEMDGFELCRTIRRDSDIPKPFEPRELLTRIQTILRRARAPAATPQSRLVFDGLSIDLERRQVLRQGEPVELTGTEFELLAMLAKAPQKVFHRDEILNRLRGQDADLYTRAVDILVSRLRKKLEPLDCIKTLRNAGYAFAVGHA